MGVTETSGIHKKCMNNKNTQNTTAQISRETSIAEGNGTTTKECLKIIPFDGCLEQRPAHGYYHIMSRPNNGNYLAVNYDLILPS